MCDRLASARWVGYAFSNPFSRPFQIVQFSNLFEIDSLVCFIVVCYSTFRGPYLPLSMRRATGTYYMHLVSYDSLCVTPNPHSAKAPFSAHISRPPSTFYDPSDYYTTVP